jgi:hypothetical protein
MLHLTLMAETLAYRFPVEHAEQEHQARMAGLAASRRRPATATRTAPPGERSVGGAPLDATATVEMLPVAGARADAR